MGLSWNSNGDEGAGGGESGGSCCTGILGDSARGKEESSLRSLDSRGRLSLDVGIGFQPTSLASQVQHAFEVVGLGEQVYEMGLLNAITG